MANKADAITVSAPPSQTQYTITAEPALLYSAFWPTDMNQREREIALRKLSGMVDDLQRAAMADDAEKQLLILVIYKLKLLAEIMEQILREP